MTRTERSMLHDALAEMTIEYADNPTPERALVLTGMRYMAGLLGMAEGHTGFVWAEPGADTADRRIRRLQIMRGPLRRAHKNHGGHHQNQ